MMMGISKLKFWSISSCFISLYLPNQWNTGALILTLVVFLSSTVVEKQKVTFPKPLFGFALLFVIVSFGLIYSENLETGIKVWLKHVPAILLPILFGLMDAFSDEEKRKVINLFVITSALIGVLSLLIATKYYFQNGTVYHLDQKGHFIYNHFMHQLLVKPLKLHAIYVSFYFSFSALWLVNDLTSDLPKSNKIIALKVLGIVFFSVLIYLLKSAVFGALFPISVLLLLALKLRLTSKMRLALLALLLLAAVYSGTLVKSKVETFNLEFNFSDEHLSPLTMRLALWQNSLDVIQKHWFFGVGTGDGMDELRNQYTENSFTIGLAEGFNSHNMYLQYWLTNGVVGLLCFLISLALLFISALKTRNVLFALIIMQFAAFSLTESTMLRHHGLIFFIAISSYFVWTKNFKKA